MLSTFVAIAALAASAIGPAAHTAPVPRPADPERVEFVSEGETLVGLLYRPAGLPPDAKPPVVVVAPPWLNVKEQVATRWAQAMADRGVAALAFDYRYWGESGGEPREYESASAKVADIQAAWAFLRGRPDLDGTRMGGLGICFGAGHMLLAAGRDGDIRSVATVAAWLHDKPSLAAVFGQAEIDRRYAAAREARAAFKAGGRVEYVPAASRTDKTAGMYFPGEGFFYADPARGEIPQWTNRMAVMSWDEWLDLDGVAAAAHVNQPVLVVHSDGSALPDNARRALAATKGPRDLFWTEGEHTQFYDSPAHVAKAADAVAAHFRRTLGGAATPPRGAQAASGEIDPRVAEFFAALEAMDIPRFVELWAEDGVQEMPYAPGNFPRRLEGREAIRRQYAPLPGAFETMRFPVSRMIASADGRTVVAELSGSIALKAGGRYDNRYVGIFEFRPDGKLQRYTEYFDPMTLLSGFPGAAAVGAPDDQRIIAAVNAVGAYADARRWAELRTVFADNVDVDYSSLTGVPATRLKADELIAGWEKGLSTFAATEHLIGGHEVLVTGDTAECRARFIASHTRGTPDSADRWTCGGRYRYTLTRVCSSWKVTGTVMTLEWEQGNR